MRDARPLSIARSRCVVPPCQLGDVLRQDLLHAFQLRTGPLHHLGDLLEALAAQGDLSGPVDLGVAGEDLLDQGRAGTGHADDEDRPGRIESRAGQPLEEGGGEGVDDGVDEAPVVGRAVGISPQQELVARPGHWRARARPPPERTRRARRERLRRRRAASPDRRPGGSARGAGDGWPASRRPGACRDGSRRGGPGPSRGCRCNARPSGSMVSAWSFSPTSSCQRPRLKWALASAGWSRIA